MYGHNMGANLTSEQVQELRQGRAIYNDNYVALPDGCAAKSIWGTPRTTASGWKEPVAILNKEGPINCSTLAVEKMMAENGCQHVYRDFMHSVYDAMETTWFWRQRVLETRKEFIPRFSSHGVDVWVCSDHASSYGHDEFFIFFADRAVAGEDALKNFRWWYTLWGQQKEAQDSYHALGSRCVPAEEANLLSADFCKVVT